ncbi:MAG: tail fiber domain-containing protein, partial [Methylobacter sp.]|nr:tail fiber domain-containing protein [Methylobacter sp.]
ASSRGFFGRTGFGIHVHASRDWTFFSTGWDPLFGIEGGTGNTSIKGVLSVPSGIRVDGGTNTHINVDGAFYRYNGQCYITMDDNLYIRDYARGNMCWFNSVNKTNTWSSDLRLKTDVTPMTGMLEKVSALQGVFFKWKDSQSDNKQLGLIAQEVDKVFPELVSTDQEGMMGVNYMGLIAVLIEALKEQQNQVQQLFALVKS